MRQSSHGPGELIVDFELLVDPFMGLLGWHVSDAARSSWGVQAGAGP